MIPKYLKIKGLYSYQEEAEINFERLEEAHIFGIFGRVGSGKSSILEAITFALYGEVSRMSSRDSRNYNLMNLKSNHLSIEFIFQSGADTYRIIVDAERNKKVFEKVERYEFRHFKFENNKWIPLSTFDPKEIIGLEKSHFMKAVIIPQNRFQDFLMMNDAERNAMMKTLFSLEKYDLMDKVKVLEAQNNTALLLTNQNFDRVKDVSKELIDTKNTEFLNLQTLIQEQQEALQKAQLLEAEMQQLKKQFEQLNTLKNEVDALEKQTPQYDSLSSQIERYQYCRLNFQNLFEKQMSVSKKLTETETEFNKNQKQLADNQLLLDTINKEFESIKTQFDKKEELKTELLDLENILKIKKLKADLTTILDRITKGKKFLLDIETGLKSLKIEKEKLDNQRQELRAQQPDFIELNAIKDWFNTAKMLKNDLEKLENERWDFNEKIEAIDKSKKALIATDLPHFGIKMDIESTLPEVISAVKKGVEKSQIDKKVLQKQLQHDMAMARVEDLASSLSDGEPCPLCGSIHHPSVMNITDIEASVKNSEKEIDRLDNVWKSLKNIEIQLETNLINFNKLKFDLQEKTNQAAQAQVKVEQQNAVFKWKKYSFTDENALNKAFETANSLQKSMGELEKKWDDAHKKIETETATLDKYQKGLTALENEKSVIDGQLISATHSVKSLDIESVILQDETALVTQQKTLQNSIENIEKLYAETDKKQRTLAEQVGILRGGIIEATKNIDSLKLEFQTVNQEIEAQLLAAPQFHNTTEITDILKLNLDIDKEQKRISEFKEKRYAADKAYSTLFSELKDKNYSSENHNALIVDNQNLKKLIENQKEQCTRLEEAIKVLLAQLKEHDLLKKELKILDARAANIKTIKQLFTSNGFVEYVSTMYLQNLCRAANERFQKLTQQQLRLEVTDKNDFQIRDMLNNGQVRSVRTLSGGQVFQAALSLAIALADSIQPLMKSKQNFFFLDEGFGSLDKESLQIVFETLKSLRKENRIVGVISHVEDMQQEIERYLKVTFDVERGSMIELVG